MIYYIYTSQVARIGRLAAKFSKDHANNVLTKPTSNTYMLSMSLNKLIQAIRRSGRNFFLIWTNFLFVIPLKFCQKDHPWGVFRAMPNFYVEAFRSIFPEVFLGKGVLRICNKFTGEHPCRNNTSAWMFSCKFAAYFQNTFS